MGCIRVHHAVNLEEYPILDVVRKLYPAYEGIKSKMKPTMVHLQVYEGMPPAPALYLLFC